MRSARLCSSIVIRALSLVIRALPFSYLLCLLRKDNEQKNEAGPAAFLSPQPPDPILRKCLRQDQNLNKVTLRVQPQQPTTEQAQANRVKENLRTL